MTTPDQVPRTDPADARELATRGAVLLDVREAGERIPGDVEGATHVPLDDLGPMAFEQARTIVVLCRSGNRVGRAAAGPADAGVDVRNMAGGIRAWAEAGLPSVDDDGGSGAVG